MRCLGIESTAHTFALAIVDDKTYSWDKAYAEISINTKLGSKILEKMKLLGIL